MTASQKDFEFHCPICRGDAVPRISMDMSHAGTNEPDIFTGQSVTYWQCWDCEFAWAPIMWRMTPEEFKAQIYTPDYGRFDPGFGGSRAMNNAIVTHDLLWKTRAAGVKMDPKIVDWGGGSGHFEMYMGQMGWENVTTCDPFYQDTAPSISPPYDFITCFEVFEHHPNPRDLVADILNVAAPGACLMFTTVTVPGKLHPSWWYIAPRSGHITFYSKRSLVELFAEHGWSVVHSGDSVHFAFEGTNPPPITRGFIQVEGRGP